jgi:hypothetical protein
MNTGLIKQLNQLNQNISEIKNKLDSMHNLIICSDDIKCDNTLTTNNLTSNNLSQFLGNVNIFGDLHLDNTKLYLNDNCYLYINNNQLLLINGEKNYIVNLTEI